MAKPFKPSLDKYLRASARTPPECVSRRVVDGILSIVISTLGPCQIINSRGTDGWNKKFDMPKIITHTVVVKKKVDENNLLGPEFWVRHLFGAGR